MSTHLIMELRVRPYPCNCLEDRLQKVMFFRSVPFKFETVESIYNELEMKAKNIEGGKIDGHIYSALNIMNGAGKWFAVCNAHADGIGGL